jgi:16S rRNA (guanine(966)-N(2))-methyltransferase RsmD
LATLRVISGSAKGSRLRLVPGNFTRPIGDRVKESLFNILADGLKEANFLDLFAGTGSVGIEALSRGCERTVFIESHPKAVQTIRENLEIARLASRGEVVQGDVFHWLKKSTGVAFDVLFLAPPQYKDLWRKTVQALDAHTHLLNPDALIVAQMDPKEYKSIELNQLIEIDQRKYGRTLLVFYEFQSE